jgi:hypothetical protein
LNSTRLRSDPLGSVASADKVTRLEQELAPLSHGTEALQLLRNFLKGLGKVSARQHFLADHMLRSPIRSQDVRGRMDVEEFHLLQGDIVRSDAAYTLGDRQIGNPSYIVATSTCDLVPGRRESALLLPVEPRGLDDYQSQQKLESDLGNLVTFRSTRYIYLPALPDDKPDVLFNVAHLDPLAQCANDALALAERRASMTLIGWRVFGGVLRSIQVREAEGEAEIRTN